jgi:hypothetical protein
MAYANLSEAVKSSAFETLSPEAKQVVFDKYSKDDSAYNGLSSEAKLHVQETYLGKTPETVGEATPSGAQPSVGMTPVTATGGGAALMAPTSRRKDIPVAEQTFGHDPQAMKLSSMGEYAKTVGTSAALGGVTGAVIGMGPLSLPLGAAGIALGAAGGLAEQITKDLGYGKGVQVLAGIAAGSKLPVDAIATGYKAVLGSSVENFIAKKLAYKIGQSTGVPGAGYAAQGMFGKAKEFITGGAKVDAEAGAKAFGQMEHINPATGEVTPITAEAARGKSGQIVNQLEVNKELAAAHPDAVVPGEPVSHGLYEQAKQSYDTVAKQGQTFLDSSEFRTLTEGIPAQETKFGNLFRNTQFQPVVGEDVVKNLRDATKQMSYKDAEKVRNAFNDYLVSTTGKPSEKLAREAFTKESLAEAKDILPGLFEKGSKGAKDIKDQLWNLSKVPEGMKQFSQEMQAYLQKATVKDAKAMWHEIGPELQNRFNIPAEKYATMTDIMNGAQTPKELSQVRRLLMKLTVPVVAGPDQEQQ